MSRGTPTSEVKTDLIKAAEALRPSAVVHRQALAHVPDLPAEIAGALKAQGFAHLWLPASLGGPELSPSDCVEVIEALARIDGTIAWCAASATNGSRLIGFLPIPARHLFIGRGAVSGSDKPSGLALRDGAGWRIKGRWAFASFVRYSDFVGAPCLEIDEHRNVRIGADGQPIIRMAMLPTETVHISSTWKATGLVASGSHEFMCDDIWVPDEQMIEFSAFASAPVEPGPLYKLPFLSAFGIGHVGVPLGIAAGSITALCELAQSKTPFLTTSLLRDQGDVQRAVARAQALLQSARAFVFAEVNALWQSVLSGDQPGSEQKASLRLALCHAATTAKTVVDLMYKQAGSSALLADSPFGAQLRDAWATAQHISFSDRLTEPMGRLLLGVEPESKLF